MSAIPSPSTNHALEAILSRVNEIAVLPHAVYKILEISGSDSSAVSELERVIKVDPGFSTRLLAHSNCAFYGLPKKVTSIKDAVMFLGFKSVRQMAMTVGFFELFAGKNDKESLRRRAWWRNSLDTAIAAKMLGDKTKLLDADEAYTVGLLHLVGQTILDRAHPGVYEKVEALVAAGVSECAAEQAVLQCDHVDVGSGACAKWCLPTQIVEGLNYLSPHQSDSAAGAIISLASSIAEFALKGPDAQPAPDWALSVLGIPLDEGRAWVEHGVAYLAEVGNPTL